MIPTLHYSGKLRKTIYVITNDPTVKTIKLSVSADIKEILAVVPRYINFGKIQKGATHKKEITILNKGEEKISITDIVVKPEGLMSIQPTNRFTLIPGQDKTLSVSFTPSGKPGYIYGSIIIKTDAKYLPKKIIRARAELLKDQKDKYLSKD